MNDERPLLGQSDNKVLLTAIIKVMDAPGGLWEVLNKIGVSMHELSYNCITIFVHVLCMIQFKCLPNWFVL